MRQFSNSAWHAANRRIVSVDGEGQTASNRHAYTLLAAADDKGYTAHVAHDGSQRDAVISESWALENRYGPDDTAANYGLPTRACLDFLLNIPKHKSDLVIAFSFTYDVTKILQDLPYRNLWEFAFNGCTEWNGYQISGLPRKYFEVSKAGKRCKVYDTFSYWQMSFVKALNSSLNLFTASQRSVIEFITYMKAERGELEKQSPADILRYCLSECELLTVMYRDLLVHCEQMGLTPRDHSGPGALANEYFAQEHMKDYMPVPDAYSVAGMPHNVPIFSYYGGRFETAWLGSIGDLIEFDIQSAYPAVCVTLPCLNCGRFRRVKEYVPGKLGFYFVGSDTSGPWAPFPFRVNKETRHLANNASKGSILFPHGGKRWVGSPEVETAIKHFGSDKIPVYDGWVFESGCRHEPFKRIGELYLVRKVGDPSCNDCNASKSKFCAVHPSPSEGLKKIVKLLINSIYGKLAQNIGKHTYQCYTWASWITSATRAKVLDAALTAGENVVSIATDGILSRTEIPSLRVTEYDLGTWERSDKRDAWLGMPGIYAFGRDPDNDKAFKRRGLDRKYFPALHMRDQWEAGNWEVGPTEPIRAFMPLKLALMRTNALDVLGEWVEQRKRVKFRSVQHKRDLPASVDPLMPHNGTAIQLAAPTVPNDVVSEPYTPKNERDVRDELDDLDIAMWSELDIDSEPTF